MTDIITKQTDKKEIRAHFLELRGSFSDGERSQLDEALFLNSVATPQFASADTILCYYPVRKEPNILPIVEYALKQGKKVAFPISHTTERHLSFHIISELSQLSVGTYNIPEPSAELPEITDFSNALCLVPALAFDKNGRRLGYGGGYYDRFLSCFNGVSMGLAYSNFYVDDLPTEAHDAAVDIMITENGGYFHNEK